MKWATAPYASKSLVQSAVSSFCNNVNSQRSTKVAVPGTGATLELEAWGEGTCAVSTSDCNAALGKVLNDCDTTLGDRRYGGMMGVGCVAYAMGVTGSPSASYMKDDKATWQCAMMNNEGSSKCACTDGKEYPLKADGCMYGSGGSTTPGGGDTTPADSQQIAVASYIHPLADK